QQSWVYDPDDIKTLEAVRSFEYKDQVYLGSERSATRRGDQLRLPGPEAQKLLKEGNCLLIAGGAANKLIFSNAKIRLGFPPWQDYTNAGVCSDTEFDSVFVPVRLNRRGQIVTDLILPANVAFMMQFGWVRRAGFQTPDERFQKQYVILDEREEAALCT